MLGRQQSESGSDEGPDNREHSAEVNTDGAPLPRIAGYELKGQIGRGASATVYLAREIKHDRLVALKVLHPALAASLQAERFLREISIIAKLAHPNILPLLDSGSVGDQLYYATPYVAGESLRGKLEREKRLSVADAVRLVREAAEALDYAHRHGLVHRDVKPENILLADGHALLADFGIARAVRAALGQQLTEAGVRPGTLHYMSPEQLSASGSVDGRSDQYSLACVLYELLSGGPPFTGGTLEEIAARHAVSTVPPFDAVAGTVPIGIWNAIDRALSKTAADRYASASDFAAALAAPAPRLAFGVSSRWLRGRRLVPGAFLLATAMGASVVYVRAQETPAALPMLTRALVAAGLRQIPLDTTRFIVVASDSGSARAGAEAASMLRAALRRWREISVEDEARVAEIEPRSGPASPRAQRAAIELGAGRFVRFSVSPNADSMTLSATLHDTRTNDQLAIREVRVPSDARQMTGAIQSLADELLFRSGVPIDRAAGPAGTSSLLARSWYFQGHRALSNGDFALAESAFVEASRADDGYPQAIVWLANLRSWFDASHLPWRQLPGRAVGRRHDLSPQDSVLLDALMALSNRDFSGACREWTFLTKLAPNDFASWYGLGNCIRRDPAVVSVQGMPNGWRFQSSTHSAVLAYEQAFRLRPAVLRGFGGQSLSELQTLMFTGGARMRLGRARDASLPPFVGYPVWQGDTLAIVALSGSQVELGPGLESRTEAIQRQRLRFREVALLWKAEFPRSPEAIEAVAIAMEMLGDPAALDTLRRARALAVDADDRLRLAAIEVLMGVKFALPADRSGLRAARILSDSLLRAHPPQEGRLPRLLGALAGLTGRGSLAASYARFEGWDETLPSALARTGPALVAFGALGGPPDSLAYLEASLEDAIRSLPVEDQPALRAAWLTRAAVLAFPESRLHSLPDTGETGSLLGNAISRALAGDTVRAVRMLTQIASTRRWLRPADIMTDGLLPEAAALVRIGAGDTAAVRLDATLRSLRLTASQDLAYAYRTGPLVRAMVLRADIALSAGDSATARLWAAPAAEMWAGADAFLQPVVRRMRGIAR